MKLLTKTSLNQFWLSIIIIVITGVMLLFMLQREISVEIEEQLELEMSMVADELAAGKPVNFPLVEVTKSDESLMDKPRIFKDTLIYDRLQKKSEGYYSLADSRIIGAEEYRIRVMTSHIGLDGYSKAVGYIFFSMALLFVFFGSLMNYFVNRKIWQPFLTNLQLLKSYSVSSNEGLLLQGSKITEFTEMNTVLLELAEKARAEYNALKEFTSNASHEIQTPLSIIQSALESISQLQVQAEVAEHVVSAKQATNRLSKVNKGLLLLAKIENNDFPDRASVNLQELLEGQLDLAQDLFAHKGLEIVKDIYPKVVDSSPFLVETLISNLLFNILAHSPKNALVKISLDPHQMVFSNEGLPLDFPEGKLFSRFGKGIDNYKGNGLGLSIVKQICLANDWEIKYNYEGNMHVFRVIFSDKVPAAEQVASPGNR